MLLFRLAGFRAVRVTSFWTARSDEADRRRAADRSRTSATPRRGTAFASTSRSCTRDRATTPLTDEARAEFASYAAALVRGAPSIEHVIVGNEPNLNRFWLPQFGLDGTSAAPAAYLALLARTYDALKAVSPDVRVYGGAVSPRGERSARRHRGRRTRRRRSSRSSASRTARAAAIDPVMDAFVDPPVRGQLEPVARDRASERTTTIGIADYGKLVTLLGEAFDGTAQPGSKLPIFYGEFGVESDIPSTKASLYTRRRARRRRGP